MVKKSLLLLILLIPLYAAWGASGDGLFENSLDGVWTGKVKLGKNSFPLVLNIDAQGSTGIGFLLLPDSLKAPPEGFEILTLTGVQVKGKKLIFTVDTGELGSSTSNSFVHRFLLRFKKKSDTLKGTLTSTDPGLGKGKVLLYRSAADKPLQMVRVGTFKKGGKKSFVSLQVIQQDDTITGFGIVGDLFGTIEGALFANKRFSGNIVAGDGEVVAFDLNLSGNRLRGNLTGTGFSSSTNLAPAGTNGKKIKVRMLSPAELNVGETTQVTIKGRNLAPGFVPHFNRDVRATLLEFVNKKEVRAQLFVPDGIADGTAISMRFVHPDNQQVEKVDVITVKGIEAIPTVSFSADIQPVFTNNCALAGCHAPPSPAQGMNLSAGSAFDNIVNVPSNEMPQLFRIEPNDPDNSYLIRKIKGVNITGGRMPLGRAPLSDEVIQMFVTWVEEGAKRN
ncbi:MAG: hypothetical protein ACE5HV_00885 [Acidobacteriota bacterium]